MSTYPLINETASVGVLTLYRGEDGDLSEAQHNGGVAVARVLTDTLLSLRSVESLASMPDCAAIIPFACSPRQLTDVVAAVISGSIRLEPL